jgi:MFS transporter, DHA1 family, multidrug resistance protein
VGCPGAASHFSWGEAPHVAGAASAVLGVVQAVALAISAPLASSGGARTAAPMIWVMLAGVAGSLISYLVVARPSTDRAVEHASTR